MTGLFLIYNVVEDFLRIDLLDKSRKTKFVDARNMYYKLSRELIAAPYETIALPVNKNHATVMHGIKCLDILLINNQDYQNIYLHLKYECYIKLVANPYEKYLGKEDRLQHNVMTYIKFAYPDVYAIHIPNEGKRSSFERYKFKYLGGQAGIPDIMIFRANKKSNGLAIELKVGYNKPTENQFKALEKLKKENWEVHWLKDYDNTTEIIDKYLQG